MKICLDAGHFAKNNQSPVVRSYYESEMSWKLHLLLKAELERCGFEVMTTRADQKKDLGLETRGRKSAGCDLFLSIHSNACDSESADHPLACVCVSGRCDVLGLDLAQTVAKVMQTHSPGRIWKRKGSGGADYYGVLRGAAAVGTPGILLEHSFHTNQRATEWLLNDSNLRRMAEAEAKVIADYFGVSKTVQPTPAQTPTPQPDPDGSFKVRIICAELNVRASAGVQYPVRMTISRNEVYTIVQTARTSDGGTWGRLKSGAGWINIGAKYVKRI